MALSTLYTQNGEIDTVIIELIAFVNAARPVNYITSNLENMKRLLLLLFLIPILSNAQVKTYGTLRAVNFNYNHTDPAFGGMFSVGALFKEGAALGVGMAVVKIPQAPNAYIPIFAEFNYFGDGKKPSPYVSIQGGYGVYQNDFVKGGAYFHPAAGVVIPFQPGKAVLISVGYISSGFSAKSNYGLSQQPFSTSLSGFAFTIGAKL